jgi:YidC/Oxa1 family membrane protein insertase
MNYDSKNFILAIVLSMAIIFGWQYFYAKPLQETDGPGTETTSPDPTTTTGGTVPDTTTARSPSRATCAGGVGARQDRDSSVSGRSTCRARSTTCIC